MEIQPSKYKPVNIPEVNINDSFWLWSLAKMSRDFPELWEFDIPKADAYEIWLEENIKDKTVCVLGSGSGMLLHIAELYGAKKCIGVDRNSWSCVYLKGLYPHWEIHCHDWFKFDWPEADVYLHNGCNQTFLDRAENLGKEVFPPVEEITPNHRMGIDDFVTKGVISFSERHWRCMKEQRRIAVAKIEKENPYG